MFTLANGTFTGNASQGCIGAGVFTTNSSTSTLGGNGTAVGKGVFHIPQGLFNGSGTKRLDASNYALAMTGASHEAHV